jgi:hypothetical protein
MVQEDDISEVTAPKNARMRQYCSQSVDQAHS